MTRRRSLLLFGVLSLSLTGWRANGVRAVAPSLPDKLTDQDYWSLVTELSEPDGEFRSDNLLSNEIFLQHVIPDLLRDAEAEPRLPWRRPGAELHLHCRPQAEDGLHRRRPARQPAAAPDVQGALRAVVGSRRLHLPACSRASVRRGSAPESTADEIFTALHKAEPQTGRSQQTSSTSRISRRPGSPDAHASSAALGRRSQGHRVRVRPVLLVRPRACPTGRPAAAAAAATRRPTGI